MPGITRIHIKSDWSSSNDWRLRLARDHEPIANEIYRAAFSKIGITLDPGEVTINVSRQEAGARYDWAEGIDVILEAGGARMTLQEKFLTYHKSTATFEERKSSGALGAWYYCTAQYYFVGYTRLYWDWRKRQIKTAPVVAFQDWILIDYPGLKRCDAMGSIQWANDKNKHDHRRASFKYAPFDSIPPACVVARRSAEILRSR